MWFKRKWTMPLKCPKKMSVMSTRNQINGSQKKIETKALPPRPRQGRVYSQQEDQTNSNFLLSVGKEKPTLGNNIMTVSVEWYSFARLLQLGTSRAVQANPLMLMFAWACTLSVNANHFTCLDSADTVVSLIYS